jgi:hypothetical protein
MEYITANTWQTQTGYSSAYQNEGEKETGKERTNENKGMQNAETMLKKKMKLKRDKGWKGRSRN